MVTIPPVIPFADSPPNTDRSAFYRRLAMLRTERQSYIDHWRDLSDVVLPRRGRFLAPSGSAANQTNVGYKKNQHIIDNTGTIALRTLASGMMAGITSPARPWFKLITPDPDMMQYGPVREWLEAVENLMRLVFSRSNLYNTLPVLYEELGCFGTAAMQVLEDYEDVIRCFTYTAGEYMIANSPRLVVDTLYREFPMTVYQLVREFGLDNCSIQTQNIYRTGNLETWVDVLHVIEPNDNRLPDKMVNSHFPWRSCYLEYASVERKFLRFSGFHEFPIMAPRWHLTGMDIYGRSPTMDALGDIKQLQLEQRRKAQAIDKQVNPPMVAPPSLRNQKVSILPGDVTYVDTGGPAGQPAFRPAFQIQFDLSHMTADIKEVQDRIRETLYSSLFMMLAQSDLQYMTAREVAERHEEKLLALGPVLERLHDELLDPLIKRTFNIMHRANLLPPAPQELQGMGLRVEYISLLAQAQKQVATSSIEQTISFAMAAAQLDPDAAHVIDGVKSVQTYADARGAPVKILRSSDDLQQRLQQAAQQRASMTAAQTAAQGVDSINKLANSPTDGKNMLTDVAKTMQGRTAPAAPVAPGTGSVP